MFCGEVIVQEPTSILNFLRKQVRDEAYHRAPLSYDVFRTITIVAPVVLMIFIDVSFFQRFNADYELSAREGADTMAYIALLDEKLRPALVFALSLSSVAWRCLMLLFRAASLRFTVAHFLGGCRKLHQRDAALVCVTLAVSA